MYLGFSPHSGTIAIGALVSLKPGSDAEEASQSSTPSCGLHPTVHDLKRLQLAGMDHRSSFARVALVESSLPALMNEVGDDLESPYPQEIDEGGFGDKDAVLEASDGITIANAANKSSRS